MKTATYKAIVYRDRAGKWRHRIVCCENGKIVDVSSESYHNRAECVQFLRVTGIPWKAVGK